MSFLTDAEQREVNEWYGGVTTSVKKALGLWAAEISLIERLERQAVDKEKFRQDAEKAQKMVLKLEKRLQRAFASMNSGYNMEVKE